MMKLFHDWWALMILSHSWWALILPLFQAAAAYRFHWRGLLVTTVAAVGLIPLGAGLHRLYLGYIYTPGSADFEPPGYMALIGFVLATFAVPATFVLIGTTLLARELLMARANARREIFQSRRTSFFLAVWSYIILSLILFGDIFKPIMLLTFFSRLDFAYWAGPLIAAPTLGFVIARQFVVGLRGAVFIVCSMMVCIGLTWIIVDVARAQEIRRFSPDWVVTRSFFESLQNAPKTFQFFLHAAAWKGCKPYAWSYREMRFYELPPNVAKNVMPVSPHKVGCFLR